jgi:hypothetical protein
MRLAILPVPPKRRIVGSREDDIVAEEVPLDSMFHFL